jgi:ATP-dependent DNA helicase RecQ
MSIGNKLHEILIKYWGHSRFRPLQQEIIESVINGHDTLALLPTGGGKSICFQVPGIYLDGVCVVISPLISLMKDQVDNLRARGVKASAVISGMSKTEIEIAFDNCIYGKSKFLYLSPERLTSGLALIKLRQIQINLIAVDEAHCISQWGYDFRPSYLRIAELREEFPEVPVIALTASATKSVRNDIVEKLNFKIRISSRKVLKEKT